MSRNDERLAHYRMVDTYRDPPSRGWEKPSTCKRYDMSWRLADLCIALIFVGFCATCATGVLG